jgi:hypothetical protein
VSKTPASSRHFDALEQLKKRQTRLRPGNHEKPFLERPADFQSPKTDQEIAAAQAKQMVQIPDPKRDPPILDLAHVIGSADVESIAKSGQFVFHCAGDTGNPKQSDLGSVVPAMTRDYHRPNPADHPAIFLHLGDVCYNFYDSITKQVIEAPKAPFYQTQFYEPYAEYPGKIIAIPGNHDSDPEEDPESIDTFQTNFCAPLPATEAELEALIKSTTRKSMYQPGVYYRLDAPFAQIIALFSNGGETQGAIRDSFGIAIGLNQWNFLMQQLTEIGNQRKQSSSVRQALILAVHHPPFSGGGGHSGSGQMLDDLDEAFKQTHVIPDVVLSGHAHCYQRYTRTLTDGSGIEIPFVVAGNGGHAINPMKGNKDGSPVDVPLDGKDSIGGKVSLRQYFNGFGHLYITVTKQIVTVDLIGTHTNSMVPVDSVTIDLNTRKITHETPGFSHPAVGEKEAHVAASEIRK